MSGSNTNYYYRQQGGSAPAFISIHQLRGYNGATNNANNKGIAFE